MIRVIQAEVAVAFVAVGPFLLFSFRFLVIAALDGFALQKCPCFFKLR
jgi:hypothetical protein